MTDIDADAKGNIVGPSGLGGQGCGAHDFPAIANVFNMVNMTFSFDWLADWERPPELHSLTQDTAS